MKDVFTSEDFDFLTDVNRYTAAGISNTKLNKLVESWPTIYCHDDNNKDCLWFPDSDKLANRLYKAKLAFIEKIPKQPCNHEPSINTKMQMSVDRYDNRFYTFINKCQKCGVELIAEWKPK